MKKFVAALTFVLFLAVGVCHAAQDKIYFAFYDYDRNELTQQIKTDITTELEDAPNIKLADATGQYIGEIDLHVTVEKDSGIIIFFYYMSYKGRFMTGFCTGQKDKAKGMCKNIVDFYIEVMIKRGIK